MMAAMMIGGELGPSSAWQFIGSTVASASGLTPVTPQFPANIQPGDLVVAVMSPGIESVETKLVTDGWLKWGTQENDYVCAAMYREGMSAPRWESVGSNYVYASLLVFRAPGWSSIRLESQLAPASPISLTTKVPNTLILNIGVTPGTTSYWFTYLTGSAQTTRVLRASSPALYVGSANAVTPSEITDIRVDASSGAERNLVLTAF